MSTVISISLSCALHSPSNSLPLPSSLLLHIIYMHLHPYFSIEPTEPILYCLNVHRFWTNHLDLDNLLIWGSYQGKTDSASSESWCSMGLYWKVWLMGPFSFKRPRVGTWVTPSWMGSCHYHWSGLLTQGWVWPLASLSGPLITLHCGVSSMLHQTKSLDSALFRLWNQLLIHLFGFFFFFW